MSQLRLRFLMVVTTVILFLTALAINELLFTRSEFTRGINWVYLPAGVRLLCTLLFGEAGIVGLLLVSWAVSFLYFFPNDMVRAFMGGILASAAPYLVYRFTQRHWGLQETLANLTPRRLLLCALAFSIASPFLHHLWFSFAEPERQLLPSFIAMATGDFVGTVLVLYAAKLVLKRWPPHH
ncbi:hypothetical protein FCL38_00975 [Pseudoduganella umbonata]|uniref:MASE1 domain-containing protein n=2 Tax=Pseudoduganella umbonata TaxID=864828 RepID=A0ABX5UG10_9BURK|nr:hypothetical protein FCL38_00975 [Pseudoduganella umbonata]